MTKKTRNFHKAKSRDSEPEKRESPAEKPVSLAPLKFEEAVKGLAKVKIHNVKSGERK